MSPTAAKRARRRRSETTKATAKPRRPRRPGGYAGKILRVDLTPGAVLGRAVGPRRDARADRRDRPRRHDPLPRDGHQGRQGQRELGPSRQPAGARHGTSGRSAGVGHGRPHRDHHRGRHQRAHLDAGQRVLRHEPQVLRLRRHRPPGAVRATGSISTSTTTWSSCATPATSSGSTPGRRSTASTTRTVCRAISSPCTPSGRPARTSRASPPSRATSATWPPRTAWAPSWARRSSRRWPW